MIRAISDAAFRLRMRFLLWRAYRRIKTKAVARRGPEGWQWINKNGDHE